MYGRACRRRSHHEKALRIGADFKLRCLGCGREVMGSRQEFEKQIKALDRPEVEKEKN